MDFHFSLSIQPLCDKCYKESLNYQVYSPFYNHRIKNSRQYDALVNNSLTYNFDTEIDPFSMPLFFVYTSLAHDNQNGHPSMLHYFPLWNNRNFFAILIGNLYSKKHIFLFCMANDRQDCHRFHKNIIFYPHIGDDHFQTANFPFSITTHNFYYKKNTLVILLDNIFLLIFYCTMSIKLFVLCFWRYLYILNSNIFVLDGFLVVGNNYHNKGMVSGTAFFWTCLSTQWNKNEFCDQFFL